MTVQLPDAGGNPALVRYAEADTTPYSLADSDDLIAVLLGGITSAKFSKGAFVLTIECPYDVIGDPTELMRSEGLNLLWEVRKVV